MIDFIKKTSNFALNDLLESAGVIFAVLCYGIGVANFSMNEIVHLLAVLTVVGLGLNAILYSHKTTKTTSLLRKSF